MLKTTHGNKTERIHALDSLRAIMMLLGVVIHSAITYGTVNYGNAWTLKDFGATNLLMDYIVFVIHNFRMPIFLWWPAFLAPCYFSNVAQNEC